MSRVRAKSPTPRTPTGLSKARLAEMIEEATVDAYGESEQATGWFTMIEQHLALPFETQVLGTSVTVTKINLGTDDRILGGHPKPASRGHLKTGQSEV